MTCRGLLLAAALIALGAVGEGAGQPLDSSSQNALDKTLQILLEPGARSAELAKSAPGTALDQQVRALAGSDALTQEFYALAGQILTELARNTGGDAQKMLQAVERARTDPAGFASLLSPATHRRLRDFSVKLSDQKR